jgi:hypothetical protein
MVDIQSVFKKFDIDPKGSINKTIYNISMKISEAQDPLVYSNRIISQLGGVANVDYNEAPIIAKCLVEQAVVMYPNYDPVAAQAIAQQKLDAIKVKMPYLFNMKEKTVEATATNTQAANKRGGDKKARALAIFEANRDKKPSDVAKLIQVELGITFANAYYYVSRVFK